MRTILQLLSLALLTGCALPKYQGTSGGFQNVQPFEQFGRRQNADGLSAYTISFWSLPMGATGHIQPILPLAGKGPPLLGVGVDVPIDPLFKWLFKP